MKKKSIYLIISALLLVFVSSCGGSSWFGFNSWDDPEDGIGDTVYYWTQAAVIPAGSKSFFTPTINNEVVDAMVAGMGNRSVSLTEEYNVNKAGDTQEQAEQLIPNVIYASFDDGSVREVLFDSRTGQKLRMQVENLKSAGEGYISVQLGDFYPVIEIPDGKGGKKWINKYEDNSTYIKIPNASVTAYCKISYYNFSEPTYDNETIEIAIV